MEEIRLSHVALYPRSRRVAALGPYAALDLDPDLPVWPREVYLELAFGMESVIAQGLWQADESAEAQEALFARVHARAIR